MSRLFKIVALVLLVFLVFRMLSDGYSSDTNSASDGEAVEAQADPKTLVDDKKSITRTVQQFVETYYHRDSDLFKSGYDHADARFRASLKPFVTTQFLEENIYSLDIPQNQTFVDSKLVRTAQVRSLGYHGHFEEEGAHIAVTVEVVLHRKARLLTKRVVEVDFLLEEFSGEWRVAGCTCDS